MIDANDSERQYTPVDSLPGEILAEILSLATHSHSDERLRYRFPSVLCQVSHTWRAATLYAPRVWSFIFIPDARALEFTQARLDRTGTVPLDIEVADPHSDLTASDVMKRILPTSGRWVTLNLHIRKVEDYAVHFPSTLPKLVQMSLKDHGPPNFIFDISFPLLKYITLEMTAICWSSTTQFPNLIEFHSLQGAGGRARVVPVDRLLDHLRNSYNLEVLELKNMWDLEEIDDEEYELLRERPVRLPRLTELRLDGVYSWELVVLLSLLQAPAVETLMLAVFTNRDDHPSSFNINQLPNINFNFPLAHTLVLRDLSIPQDDIKLILRQVPPIKKLSIIGSDDPGMAEVLEMIIFDPSLTRLTSRLSEISIKGIKILTLTPHLSPSSPPQTSISLLGQLNLRIHSESFHCNSTEGDVRRQHDEVLEKLRALIPNVESTDSEPWWG